MDKKKSNNHFTKSCLTEKLFPVRQNKNLYISQKSTNKLRTIFLKFPKPPKAKKQTNNIYLSKELVRQQSRIEDCMSTFCKDDAETEHFSLM